ncbi:MAG: hypothetical protein KAG61_03935 [Bacteriovoracaceae bacterium]|nr:hypothetical protein [Bacteriovoracaceae bacterium]
MQIAFIILSIFISFSLHASILFDQGLIHIKGGEFQEGLRMLERAFETDDSSASDRVKIAKILAFADNKETNNNPAYYAKYALKFGNNNAKDLSRLERILGDYYFIIADLEGAEKSYLRIRSSVDVKNPLYEYATYKLGWVLINKGSVADVLSLWEQYLRSSTHKILLPNILNDYGKFWMEESCKTGRWVRSGLDEKFLSEKLFAGIKSGYLRACSRIPEIPFLAKGAISKLLKKNTIRLALNTGLPYRNKPCLFVKMASSSSDFTQDSIKEFSQSYIIGQISQCQYSDDGMANIDAIVRLTEKSSLKGVDRLMLGHQYSQVGKINLACSEYVKGIIETTSKYKEFIQLIESGCDQLSLADTVSIFGKLLPLNSNDLQLDRLLKFPTVVNYTVNNIEKIQSTVSFTDGFQSALISALNKLEDIIAIYPSIKLKNRDRYLVTHIYTIEGRQELSSAAAQLVTLHNNHPIGDKALTSLVVFFHLSNVPLTPMFQEFRASRLSKGFFWPDRSNAGDIELMLSYYIKEKRFDLLISQYDHYAHVLFQSKSALQALLRGTMATAFDMKVGPANREFSRFLVDLNRMVFDKGSVHFPIPRQARISKSLYRELTIIRQVVSAKSRVAKVRTSSIPRQYSQIRSVRNRVAKTRWENKELYGIAVERLNRLIDEFVKVVKTKKLTVDQLKLITTGALELRLKV